MPRQIRDVGLQTRDARRQLAPRKEPYWKELRRGLHVGYYKGSTAGTWWLGTPTKTNSRLVMLLVYVLGFYVGSFFDRWLHDHYHSGSSVTRSHGAGTPHPS